MNVKIKYLTNYRVFFWLIIMISAINPAIAQTFSKKTFTTDNGLSHNYVQHIAQDKTGFLWISTWDGISRYDGYEFKNYYHKPYDSTTVPFFVVDKAVVDRCNNVWVMCQQRPVVIYNRNTDSFDRLKPDDLNELVIYDITSGPDSTIWLYSRNNNLLYHFDGDKKLLSKFRLVGEDGIENFIVDFSPQILIDNKGGVWFISIINRKYEVFRGEKIDGNTVKLYSVSGLPIEITGDDSGFKTLAMYDIFVDGADKIMLFSKFGLFYYDRAIKQFIETDSSVITGKLSGKQYYFWSDEKSGIHVFDSNQNRIISIKTEHGKFIENLFIDRQGTIWSADYIKNREDIGLNRYVPTPAYFKYFLTGENSKHKLQKIPGNKNSDKLIAMRGVETIFKFYDDNSFCSIAIPPVNGKIPQINSVARDSLGAWLGCSDNLLIRYNFKNDEFTLHILKPEGEIENTDMRIHNILPEGNNLIINAKRAIYRYNITDEKLKAEYIHKPNFPCFSIVGDGKGGYWIAVNNNTIKNLSSDFKELATYRFDEGRNNVEHICFSTVSAHNYSLF